MISRRRFMVQSAAAGLAIVFAAPGPVQAEKKEEAKWGDLKGRFVFDGKPPEPKKLKVDRDLECCVKFDIRDESLMVAADGGLANVYVWLRNSKASVCPDLTQTAPKQVVLDNRDCIFKPHCMAIWYPKQQYSIVNSDPIAQNVAFSPLGDTPANIVLAVGGNASYEFHRKQSAPVPIACNYHPWERAYVLPRDNPYVAISAGNGRFSLTKLPVGEWEFQVWHERPGWLELPQWPKGRFRFAIKAGDNDLGTIKIAPARLEAKR
ncbi:MAG: twin-arginine translocation signal domain-containing protein [Planctomycetaceae bacterium]|nr:twin-arginine translocation signal domain-containing protein [Planctomycetaceae bacterium]